VCVCVCLSSCAYCVHELSCVLCFGWMNVSVDIYRYVYLYICMCILAYMYICGCTRVYVYACVVYMYGYINVWVCYACVLSLSICLVVWYSDPDPCEIRTSYERFRVVLVMDPIHWRFEDRPMGWFKDLYQFMQWRPDDDTNPNRVILCECLLLYYFLIYRCQ